VLRSNGNCCKKRDVTLNRTQALSAKAEAELDELLAEIDQVALLKARALYTLKLKQEPAA